MKPVLRWRLGSGGWSRWWVHAKWRVLVALAAVAFILGYLGFRTHYLESGTPRSPWDLAYLTLQLFTLESGVLPVSRIPWQLDVARFMAPFATGTALATVLVAALHDQLEDWRLRRARRHVVVCGLGVAGATLASSLLDVGHRVVCIEEDGRAPAVLGVERKGGVVVIGDPRDENSLLRAGIDRASHLVVLLDSDNANAEVVARAATLASSRRGPSLTCLAQVADPDLADLMRAEELNTAHFGSTRLDFFNLEAEAARMVLREHPPVRGGRPHPGQAPPHVLVVGFDRPGRSLVTELGRLWRSRAEPGGTVLPVVVVAPAASESVGRLRRRLPELDQVLALDAIDAVVDPLDPGTVGGLRVDVAYVCMGDDSAAVRAGLALRHALSDAAAPVVVELLHSGGLAHLLDRPEYADRVLAVDVMERLMGPDLLLGGTYELLARAIHEEYRSEQLSKGVDPSESAAMVPWEVLDDSLKESNRDQAAHIGVKLAAVGRSIAPSMGWNTDEVALSPAEVELLARMEHQRWVDERTRNGWTPGPKDHARRQTPYLVPWDELDDEVRELDRQAVLGMPVFLSKVGYRVVTVAR